jgi:hypothetical protein
MHRRGRLAGFALAVPLLLCGCGDSLLNGAADAALARPPAAAPASARSVAVSLTSGSLREVNPGRVLLPVGEPSTPKPSTLPDGTRQLLPGHRVVAYYGAAGTPALGVLGSGSPDDVWRRLSRQAQAYRARRGPAVMPAYELIAYIATAGRGNQGNYSSRVPNRVIDRYARAAKRHGALLILDIQPGRGDFLRDAGTLSKWLRLPYVGLALDPEWKLYGGELPLSHIGHTDARTINHVSAWLGRLTKVSALPQKPLLVHQFTADMVRHKSRVVPRPHLAIVFNIDGFGNREAKLSKYREFARDRFGQHPRFPMGLKLFYDKDTNILPPGMVRRQHPDPSVVEYQ